MNVKQLLEERSERADTIKALQDDVDAKREALQEAIVLVNEASRRMSSVDVAIVEGVAKAGADTMARLADVPASVEK